jgi:predicted RNase H-like HicB family nuclease
MTTYVALIHKDPDSDYGVSFPDLPGCVTAGSTLDEAIAMAKEALALHIEGLLEDNEDVPAPTPADQIDRDDALLVTAIEVPDDLKVERINVTVPALALLRFDAFAERRGMTRSGLFVEAAQRWIAQETAQETAQQTVLTAIQDAFSARELDQTPDELIERLLRLAEELEKTARAMMKRQATVRISQRLERA